MKDVSAKVKKRKDLGQFEAPDRAGLNIDGQDELDVLFDEAMDNEDLERTSKRRQLSGSSIAGAVDSPIEDSTMIAPARVSFLERERQEWRDKAEQTEKSLRTSQVVSGPTVDEEYSVEGEDLDLSAFDDELSQEPSLEDFTKEEIFGVEVHTYS